MSENRQERFARKWSLVGLSTKTTWRRSKLHERILLRAVEDMKNTLGDKADAILAGACFTIGSEDGKQMSHHMKLRDKNARDCLLPVETMCLMAGKDARIMDENAGAAVLKVDSCPYSEVLDGVCPSLFICENHIKGMVQSVNRKAVLIVLGKKCKGDAYCEFRVEL
ncbi:MAG TPA: hypothetical protein HA257_00555 [Candidatus Methanoperedenaceae archaeon]|nr:hypothetical protein [Candidatus Methanoperedenaceae archaeon]